MPSTDPGGYPQGHVGRVYEYVIAPACRKAGYFPTQADVAAAIDPLDVVREIVNSDVAIFDISANNTNALYGLAIRHALGLPVIVVKDVKSMVAFNAMEIGTIEYDESLRIDTVQREVETLSTALTKAVESKKDKHEMLNRLGIGVGRPVVNEAPESIMPETIAPPEKHIPVISPLPGYVGDSFTAAEITKLKPGDELFHLNYGRGKLNSLKKMGKDELANIQFESGSKLLVMTASDNFRKIRE